jgi:DNA-binding response OmpR family regulator
MFTRDEILSRVWRHDYFGGLRTVDVNVRLVRALGQDHARLIETVRRVGYRFQPARVTENGTTRAPSFHTCSMRDS